MGKIKKDNLGYLGVEFQHRLVKMFIEEPRFFERIEGIVDQNMFTDNSLRNIVRIMKDGYAKYKSVPGYDSLYAELGEKNTDSITLGIDRETLAKIKDEVALTGYDEVRELSERFFKQQNMVKVANKVLSIAADGDLDRFDECKTEFEKVVETTLEDDDAVNPMDLLDTAMSPESVESIPTGVRELDFCLGGGLDKGKLGLVIGPAGFGKTTMMTAFSYQAAVDGYKVLQIVFEDEDIDLTRKYISRMTGVESFLIKTKHEIGGLSDEDREKVRKSVLNSKEMDLIKKNVRIKRFLPGSGITASDIIAYIKRQINKGFKPDLVTIDYFETIEHEKGGGNLSEWSQEGVTMRKLEGAAKDLNVAIWIPSQGGKSSFTAQIVDMSMGSGSVKKQQIAQVVMSISRTLDDIDNNTATLTVLKNRAGRSGASYEGIYFNNGTCTISFDNVREHKSALLLKEAVQEQRQRADHKYVAQHMAGREEDMDY